MFCTKCGKHLPENSKFCIYCGNLTAGQAPQPAVPQQPAFVPEPVPQVSYEQPTVAADPVPPAPPVADEQPDFVPEPVPQVSYEEPTVAADPVPPVPPVADEQPDFVPEPVPQVSYEQPFNISAGQSAVGTSPVENQGFHVLENIPTEPDSPIGYASTPGCNYDGNGQYYYETSVNKPVGNVPTHPAQTMVFSRIFCIIACSVGFLIAAALFVIPMVLPDHLVNLSKELVKISAAIPLGIIFSVIMLFGIFSLIFYRIKSLRIVTVALMWLSTVLIASNLYLFLGTESDKVQLDDLYNLDPKFDKGLYFSDNLWRILFLSLIVVCGISLLISLLTRKFVPFAVSTVGISLGYFVYAQISAIGIFVQGTSNSEIRDLRDVFHYDFSTLLFDIAIFAIIVIFGIFTIFSICCDTKQLPENSNQ